MKPFWKIWRKKSIRMKWTIGLPPCHFDHLISLSQTTGSNHCPVWVLWTTPWVRTLRCSNSSPPSWKSYSRISMQRVHHLSMRNMNAGICPFLGVITPRSHDKYKLCSTQAPSKAAHHSTCWQVVLNNTFLGILLQFRKDLIAISADLQQMFYGFLARPDHRDCSRYLWHKDNEKIKISITCTCTSLVIVHPQQSQSIASEEQLKKVSQSLKQTRQFVERHFYVDDGLISLPTESAVINLLKHICASLAESNLIFHNIASNRVPVMQAFEPQELATGIRDLGLNNETPTQRSLGLCWDIKMDTFTSKVAVSNKPYTRGAFYH